MAGAFAHMSVVDALCSEPEFLSTAGQFGPIARYSITQYKNFCELGSVSPDLPYLDLLHSNSKGWGNVMHYWKTADIIRAGVSYFASKNFEQEDQDPLRALAWLFGYSAHVATDLTVHPVLVASGYPYATNPKGHRFCELHQDAYIFRKFNRQDPDYVRYIENCGIASCTDPNTEQLHSAVNKAWLHCLSGISPSQVQLADGVQGPTDHPTPPVWFSDYTRRAAEYVEHGGGFVLFLRDLIEAEGLSLPESGKVDMKYITDLKTPNGQPTNCDAVFDKAVENVQKIWLQLAAALAARNQDVFALKNADLDTGEADDDKTQVFVFA